MRFPFIRRSTHEQVVASLLEDHALSIAQSERAHADALDRYRGRMRPALREAADRDELLAFGNAQGPYRVTNNILVGRTSLMYPSGKQDV